jgi:tRNA dimethylallyltransferase
MEQQKKIILLAGPTASGKSKLAIKLATKLRGEIINADSMQIYKEISILTSKPRLQDIKKIKHHLYGFNSVKNFFSTGHWLQQTLKKIDEIWKNKKIPIVVGGSGLYFKALTDGLVRIPDIPKNLRTDVRKLQKNLGQIFFYKELVKLDPLAKKFIIPSDTQRSMRAFEVKKFLNKSLFELTKKTKPNYNNNIFKKIFINPPKELLHKNIEKRVEKMFKDGVVDEVKKFSKINLYSELSANKIIGIKEISDYLHGKATIIKTKELIVQKTRQYAKRQFTWARGHMKSWEMIYSPNSNDLYNKVINKIF